jgi:hypothetical protein
MRAALIGDRGFAGGNLLRQAQLEACYHSANIEEICGQELDVIVCAGITALKWRANQNAREDLTRIRQLLDCVTRARAARVYIISTIENCGRPVPNHAYGANRLYFEEALRAKFCRRSGLSGGRIWSGPKKETDIQSIAR